MLCFLRDIFASSSQRSGDTSISHPTELHCYNSLRLSANKRWFACPKLSRKKADIAGLHLTQCIRWLVTVWIVFDNTHCQGTICWISFKMTGLGYLCKKAGLDDVAAAVSNGAELRTEVKSPLAPGAAESAQSPSATDQGSNTQRGAMVIWSLCSFSS